MELKMLTKGSLNSPVPSSSVKLPLTLRTCPANYRTLDLSKLSIPKHVANATTSSENSNSSSQTQTQKLDPSTQFSSLANTFSRRLLVGSAAAAGVAIGGNLGGITSLLLGFQPEKSRNLKLDVVYPVKGYKRCFDTTNGFEFVYPSTWVGDQRLLYRAVERAEKERLLDLDHARDTVRPQEAAREPIVAFGPPGSNGELNISVIVAPVPTNFTIEKFGEPKQAGEVILNKFIVSRSSNITAMLIYAKKKEDYFTDKAIIYYNLEYTVQGPTFSRHNIAVCTTSAGRLYTLNAQCPGALWPTMKDQFYEMADSFKLFT